MKRLEPIVYGGGWKNRKHFYIKLGTACCLVAFLLTMIAAGSLIDRIGAWGFIVPTVLLVASLVLFRYERAQVWWGPPDACMPDTDRPGFGEEASPLKVPKPKHDLHNLY